MTNGRLLQAIFSEDAIKNKRNTEVVEVTPNTLVVARVLNHRPAAMRSMAAAKDEITMLVIRQQAAEAAIKEGEEKLARLQKGDGAKIFRNRVDGRGFDHDRQHMPGRIRPFVLGEFEFR